MKKRAELLDNALEAQIKLGAINDITIEDFTNAKIARAAFVNSVLEDLNNYSNANLSQDNFDKLAAMIIDDIAIEDLMKLDTEKLSSLVCLKTIEKTAELKKLTKGE